MKLIKYLVVSALLVAVGTAVFVYSGVYPVGADVKHNTFTVWLLETLREESIKKAAVDIDVPPLNNPELLLSGGPDYNEMCAGCHLKPGVGESDLSLGLYPTPPNLTTPKHVVKVVDTDQVARRQFWIIKHGIKASGMPAWGPTHDDQRIWAMVAFIQKLPSLNKDQYQILTARESNSESSHH